MSKVTEKVIERPVFGRLDNAALHAAVDESMLQVFLLLKARRYAYLQ